MLKFLIKRCVKKGHVKQLAYWYLSYHFPVLTPNQIKTIMKRCRQIVEEELMPEDKV